jgi:signal transduction histidine kinase
MRVVSAGLVVVLLAGVFVAAIVTRRGVINQERRLLRERSSEIGLILSGAFSNLDSSISATAAQTQLNGSTPTAFTAAVTSFLHTPNGVSGLADTAPAVTRFVTVVGGTLPPTATGVRDRLIRRSLTTPGTATGVFDEGGVHYLALAHAIGTGPLAILLQLPVNPASAGTATAAQQPFHELSVALYAATVQDPTQLLLTTGAKAPLRGDIATSLTTVGADQWLVAVKAKTPLVGSFAENAYWIILVFGVVIALALGALLESLLRRRDYAMVLVDQRTAQLRQSLADLEVAQEQLVRHERLAAIGELASAVGHELRNPLGVITNALYLLRAGLGNSVDERILRQLVTAEREVGAAGLIVGDLLDFSRAREPVTSTFDLDELMDEVVSIVPPPPSVTVDRAELPGPIAVTADRDQLRQVLLNLLSNAYEAMPEGGQVEVALSASDSRVHIVVVDNGAGMDQETLGRVFEPFFTRKAKGIGLGLAVTRRIVEAHGGTIAVHSEPGEGARFSVDLPSDGRRDST